jgi:peroxiredoxin (alkyl hydroperoxide reductase subunit C)
MISMVLQIGQKAPDFTAQSYMKGEMKEVTLSSYAAAGKWTVLFFYPLDFTFVCPTEIKGFDAMIKDFETANVQVLGASVDSQYSHQAWCQGSLGELSFPLISDLSHRISRDYGILNEEKGLAYRAVFIIDPNGVLRSYLVNDLSVGRNVEEILRTVQAFQTGSNCPVNWKPGQATL